jgi:hypothetical protein
MEGTTPATRGEWLEWLRAPNPGNALNPFAKYPTLFHAPLAFPLDIDIDIDIFVLSLRPTKPRSFLVVLRHLHSLRDSTVLVCALQQYCHSFQYSR